MGRIRVGVREQAQLAFIVGRGYLLVPGESGDQYSRLESKGLITMTASKSHKTLKSQKTIVDIWRIDPTDLGRSVAGEPS